MSNSNSKRDNEIPFLYRDVSGGTRTRVSRSLSEQVYANATGTCLRRGSRWHETHAINEEMQASFSLTANAVREKNYKLSRASYKLNVMLTVNLGWIAMREGGSTDKVFSVIKLNLRNSFRGLKQDFAGFWRYEIKSSWTTEHVHIVFHAPRGLRAKLIEALPNWTGDPHDQKATPSCFKYGNWQVKSVTGIWHLRRVYDVPGLIEYLAKIPTAADGEPLTRSDRLKSASRSIRERGIFGVGPLNRLLSKSANDFGKCDGG